MSTSSSVKSKAEEREQKLGASIRSNRERSMPTPLDLRTRPEPEVYRNYTLLYMRDRAVKSACTIRAGSFGAAVKLCAELTGHQLSTTGYIKLGYTSLSVVVEYAEPCKTNEEWADNNYVYSKDYARVTEQNHELMTLISETR